MAKKNDGKERQDLLSRRNVIAGTLAGLVAGVAPVRGALSTKQAMAQERDAINRTIAGIMDAKMRGVAPDAAKIYTSVGGKSAFTKRLFAETFGSRSARKRGLIDSNPAKDTPINEINEALIKVANRLSSERVKGVTGKAVEVGAFDPGQVASDYICLQVGSVAGGGRIPDLGDPMRPAATTWILASPASLPTIKKQQLQIQSKTVRPINKR